MRGEKQKKKTVTRTPLLPLGECGSDRLQSSAGAPEPPPPLRHPTSAPPTPSSRTLTLTLTLIDPRAR